MTHEPTPWQIEGTPEKGVFFISTVHPSPLFHCKWFLGSPERAKANAEYIIKAVNSHEELTEAVELLLACVYAGYAPGNSVSNEAISKGQKALAKDRTSHEQVNSIP